VPLRDADAAASFPAEWQAHASWDGDKGEIVTGPIPGTPLTDFKDILVKFGYDPELVEIVGKVSQWKKERPNGSWLTSYFFGVAAKQEHYDLPALYAAAKARPRAPRAPSSTQRATVAVFADPQIGKTGRRGGTPELIDRMAEKRERLEVVLKERKPSQTALFDAGDGFEGFNSGGNPYFTNDLSLSQQIDCYSTELYLLIGVLQRHGPVDVGAVTSNHTAWRNGKQQLGRPSDDLGLLTHRMVKKQTDAAGINATWHLPAEYDESIAVDLLGTLVGMVHGNQFGPGQAISWWEKQTFGAQAVTQADVLVTGHYHTFGSGVAGRNPATGRQRMWLGAPTLDNGSDWYRQTAGRDSDPGMLVFDITPEGFDLQSLTIL